MTEAPEVLSLDTLVGTLRSHPAIQNKVTIRQAYEPALPTLQGRTSLGDDCAVLPDGTGGYLLLAAEGLLPDFVASDPWFAGYSAVMVNVSDVCAMGGWAVGVVDVIWAPDSRATDAIWEGLRAAAHAYDVPVVGGHTTLTRSNHLAHLSVAILGRAEHLLSSFEAKPGDDLLMVIDLDGQWRGDRPFWNASVSTPPERLRELAALFPTLASRRWCHAAKDISNGGVLGTLIMLLECSSVGADVDLENIPRPLDADLLRWLLAFPSYGFLLSVPRRHTAAVTRLFASHDVCCARIGSITDGKTLTLRHGGQSSTFWTHPSSPGGPQQALDAERPEEAP